MDAQQQEKTIKALQDWSKWLVGLNVFVGTGCVIVLERGIDGGLQPFIVTVIFCFVLAALMAALLIRVLAIAMQQLPLCDRHGILTNLTNHRVQGGITIGRLTQWQFV